MTMTRPTTEQITHNGQILKDVLGPVFNVLSFGAKGDGVTDDLPAIRAAVVAAIANGGGTVFIPRTANGYFIPVAYGINLDTANNLSIVSDGAEIKMAGAPSLGAGAAAPFLLGGSIATGTLSNFTMRGLRFSCTSTTLRYDNGDPLYDIAVNDGSASALVQTSFRYVMNVQGTTENVNIEDCEFLDGIYYGISIKNPPSPAKIRNLRFSNIRFLGVNHVCIYTSGCVGLTMNDILCENGQDSRFDHLLYASDPNEAITGTNIVCKNNNTVSILLRGEKNVTFSNVRFENCDYGFVFGDPTSPSENITISNVVCTGGTGLFYGLGGGAKDILISNVVVRDCNSAFAIGDTSYTATWNNIVVRNFIVDSCTTLGTLFSGTNLVLADGIVIDPDPAQRVFTTGNTSGSQQPLAPSTFTMRNVDFVFSNGRLNNVLHVTGSLWNYTLDNCSFRNLGSPSSSYVLHNSSGALAANVSVRNCRSEGLQGTLNIPVLSTINAANETLGTEVVFLANSVTPTVADCRLLVTANTSATAYTNFTNGVQGQEIWIRVNDANTTFDFTGTNLKGNNGVDYTATSGDVIFAKRIGSNWYCTVVEA